MTSSMGVYNVDWEYRAYVITPRTSPIKSYRVDSFMDLDAVDEQIRTQGQISRLQIALPAELGGVALPVTPRNGYEFLFYKHHLSNPLLSEPIIGGRIMVRRRRPTPENQIYAITIDSPERDLNKTLYEIQFDGGSHPFDSDRILALFTAAFPGAPGPGWNASNYVAPIVEYPASNVEPFNKKTVLFILNSIIAYPGDPAVSPATYPVPARRWHIHCEWSDPLNAGIDGNGMRRYLHYYAADQIAIEPIPLTDHASGLANSNADDFDRANSTNLGNTKTGAPWSTWGTGGTFRINGNRLGLSTGLIGVRRAAVATCYSATGRVRAQIYNATLGNGVCGRMSVNGSNQITGFAGAYYSSGGNKYAIVKLVNSTPSVLASVAAGAPPANGDFLELGFSGNTITLYRNGVSLVSTVDATNNTSTMHGLFTEAASSDTVEFDNFGFQVTANVLYDVWEQIDDLTPVINVAAIEGPGNDPIPVTYETKSNVDVTNDGTIAKNTGSAAWDAGAISNNLFGADGGYVETTIAAYMLSFASMRNLDQLGLGKPERGPNFTYLQTWEIQNYLAKSTATVGAAAAVQNINGSRVITEVEMPVTASSAGVAFRYQDASNYWAFVNNGAGNYAIQRTIAGVDSTPATGSGFAPANGDFLKVSLEDNDIKCYARRPGGAYALLATYNSATLANLTSHGIAIRNAAVGTAARFRNLKIWSTYGQRQMGMAVYNTSYNPDTVPFAWRFLRDRTARPYENGVAVGSAVPYSDGDRFRLSVEIGSASGTLYAKYYKRAAGVPTFALVYTSLITPAPSEVAPYYVDASIYDGGAALSTVTARRSTFNIYRNLESIAEYQSELWSRGVIKDPTLITPEARQERADQIFSRHAFERVTQKGMTDYPYRAGRGVLVNIPRLGLVDELRVITGVEPRRRSGENPDVGTEYILTLGDNEREYGDLEPLGVLLRGKSDDGESPDPPSGLAVTRTYADTPNTSAVDFSWVQTTGDEQWIDIQITDQATQNAYEPFRFPAENNRVGTVPRLEPNRPYYARARSVDYNGNIGEYGAPVEFVTAPEAAPPVPSNLAVAASYWDPNRRRPVNIMQWDPIVGIPDLKGYILLIYLTGIAFTAYVPKDASPLQYVIEGDPLQVGAVRIASIDYNDNQSNFSDPAVPITFVDSPNEQILVNGSFETPAKNNAALPYGYQDASGLGAIFERVITGTGGVNAYSGGWMGRLRVPNGSLAAGLLPVIPFAVPGPGYYTLKVALRSEGVQARAYLDYTFRNAAYGVISTGTMSTVNNYAPPTGSWANRSALILAPLNTAFISIQARNSQAVTPASNSDLYIDSLVLTKGSDTDDISDGAIDGAKWNASVIATSALSLTAPAAGSIPLDINGASGQTAQLFRVRSFAAATLAEITAAGNVGIGAAAGLEKLLVTGSARFTSDVTASGKLIVTGLATFGSTLGVAGNVTIDAAGSSSGTPRVVGFSNFGYARLQFGDIYNAIQASNSGQMNFQSYWGIVIAGSRQTTGSTIGFVSGAASDPSLNVYGTNAGNVILAVTAPGGQSTYMQEWRNALNTRLSAIDQTGAFVFGSNKVLGARSAAYTQTYSTADRTLGAYTSDPENVAYVAPATLAAAAPLTGANALRVAYENLRVFTEDLAAFVNALVDDLQTHGMIG